MTLDPRTLAALALIASLLSIPVALPAWAQHHPHGAAPASPYTGLQDLPTKALSEQDVQKDLPGAGMGYALAAELNGYPGPKHVLELKDHLGLSADQEARIQAAFDAMQTAAAAIGNRLVEQERLLDRLFAGGHADSASVASLAGRIATLEGELRAVHLNAHVTTRSILTPEQTRRYNELRGYTGGNHQHQH